MATSLSRSGPATPRNRCVSLPLTLLQGRGFLIELVQGFNKGSQIALVGPVQVSWYAGQAVGTLTQPSAAASPAPSDAIKEEPTDSIPPHVEDGEDSHMHDEPEPAGWGGDDDGFGML